MWHCAFKFNGSNGFQSLLNPSGRKTRTSSATTRQATGKAPMIGEVGFSFQDVHVTNQTDIWKKRSNLANITLKLSK